MVSGSSRSGRVNVPLSTCHADSHESSLAMKQVFVSQQLFEVEMRKERLEQAGIPCMIKNQRSSGLAGEIPFPEIFPELWVIHNEDYDQARHVLEEGLVSLASSHNTWTCASCGERHESQFAACWKCGQEQPFLG